MPAHSSHHFRCQIRGTGTYESSTMDGSADVTVVDDSLHPNGLRNFDSIEVYVADDHDQALDVSVEHSHPGDATFTHALEAGTTSLAAGTDSDRITVSGPVGRLQIVVDASALSTAPASGSLLAYVLATG